MTHPVPGVDHVVVLVKDLDARRDAYRRMGFTVSPRGLHSAHKGSANHTIMFPHDYLELMGLIAETEGNASRRRKLAEQGEGLHAVACRTADAAAAGPALAALGVATEGLSDFARPAPPPAAGEAAFTTLDFAAPEVPLGMCFMCQHRTPETVWIPEFLTHANGAEGLSAIVAACDDPRATAERFARLFAAGAVLPLDGGARVETGADSAALEFVTPAKLAALYPADWAAATPRGAFAALRLHVSARGRARAALEAGGVPFEASYGGVAVAPAETGGVILDFLDG
jgi:hypothetical protein